MLVTVDIEATAGRFYRDISIFDKTLSTSFKVLIFFPVSYTKVRKNTRSLLQNVIFLLNVSINVCYLKFITILLKLYY